ncbi:DNA polymerase III subunit gamma/tau domain-containing protein [Flindersiella endophytica]
MRTARLPGSLELLFTDEPVLDLYSQTPWRVPDGLIDELAARIDGLIADPRSARLTVERHSVLRTPTPAVVADVLGITAFLLGDGAIRAGRRCRLDLDLVERFRTPASVHFRRPTWAAPASPWRPADGELFRCAGEDRALRELAWELTEEILRALEGIVPVDERREGLLGLFELVGEDGSMMETVLTTPRGAPEWLRVEELWTDAASDEIVQVLPELTGPVGYLGWIIDGWLGAQEKLADAVVGAGDPKTLLAELLLQAGTTEVPAELAVGARGELYSEIEERLPALASTFHVAEWRQRIRAYLSRALVLGQVELGRAFLDLSVRFTAAVQGAPGKPVTPDPCLVPVTEFQADLRRLFRVRQVRHPLSGAAAAPVGRTNRATVRAQVDVEPSPMPVTGLASGRMAGSMAAPVIGSAAGPADAGAPRAYAEQMRLEPESGDPGLAERVANAPGFAGPLMDEAGLDERAADAPELAESAMDEAWSSERAGNAPEFAGPAVNEAGLAERAGNAPGFAESAMDEAWSSERAGNAPGFARPAMDEAGLDDRAADAPEFAESATNEAWSSERAGNAPGFAGPAMDEAWSNERAANAPEFLRPAMNDARLTERAGNAPEFAEPAKNEARPNEYVANEPGPVQPASGEPVSAESVAAGSEVSGPEVAEPEVAEPEATEPVATESSVPEPGLAEPEAAEAELVQPELPEPSAAQAEATVPETPAEPELSGPGLAELNLGEEQPAQPERRPEPAAEVEPEPEPEEAPTLPVVGEAPGGPTPEPLGDPEPEPMAAPELVAMPESAFSVRNGVHEPASNGTSSGEPTRLSVSDLPRPAQRAVQRAAAPPAEPVEGNEPGGVLAQSYRMIDRIIGQPALAAALREIASSPDQPVRLLVAGPPGTGRGLTVDILSRLLTIRGFHGAPMWVGYEDFARLGTATAVAELRDRLAACRGAQLVVIDGLDRLVNHGLNGKALAEELNRLISGFGGGLQVVGFAAIDGYRRLVDADAALAAWWRVVRTRDFDGADFSMLFSRVVERRGMSVTDEAARAAGDLLTSTPGEGQLRNARLATYLADLAVESARRRTGGNGPTSVEIADLPPLQPEEERHGPANGRNGNHVTVPPRLQPEHDPLAGLGRLS